MDRLELRWDSFIFGADSSILCTVRLSARTPTFHVGKMGSILIRCTILKHIAEDGSVRQGDPIAYVVSVL